MAASRESLFDRHHGGGVWYPNSHVLGDEAGDRWHWQGFGDVLNILKLLFV